MSEQKSGQASADERRDFLKGGLAAAGGAALEAAGAGAQGASAQSNPMPGRSIHLAVKPGVDAKAVHAALDRIFDLAGCVACGLNGILDFRIDVVHSVINARLKGIVGVSENLRGF